MADPEKGRKHLSSEILRIIDSNRLPYQEMEPGQILSIFAEDAKTKEFSSFSLVILSTKDLEGKETPVFQYVDGNFNFYDAHEPNKTIQIKQGLIIEGGVSAIFIPQSDMKLVYFGGIEVGSRDHSFEHIDGSSQSAIAHKIREIEIHSAPSGFQVPDLTSYFEKVASLELKNKKIKEDKDIKLMGFLEENFESYPDYEEIKNLIETYSTEGKMAMLSFLKYAVEDGVFQKAWEILKKYHESYWSYDHPDIRGNLDLKINNTAVFQQMLNEADIRWPRQGRETDTGEEIDTSHIPLPENKEFKVKLQKKLKEYESRLTKSDASEKLKLDAQHKIAVLGEVLNFGSIDTSKLEKQLKKNEWFDQEMFENAIFVIADYIQTGGKNISGGTGLK